MYTSLRHFRAKTYRNKGFFTKKWKTLHCRFPARAAVFLHPFAVLLHVVCISCIKLRFSCTKMQLSCNSVAVFLQPCGSFPAHGCKKAATVRVKAATLCSLQMCFVAPGACLDISGACLRLVSLSGNQLVHFESESGSG